MVMQQIKRLYSQICAGWQTFWQREEGANLIIVALSMTTLLGFAGLAIDGSYAYYQNQRMQIAADAAALGGARLLALGNSTVAQVEAEVAALATQNGAGSYTLSFLNGNTEIEVTALLTFDTFFASIVGYDTMTVSASANAHFAGVTGTGNLMPFTITCNDMAGFTLGQEVILHDSDSNAPGNVGWIRWDGDNPSATDLVDNLNNPHESPILQIGNLVNGTTGNTNADGVETAFEKWYGEQVIVPLYDQVTGTGSNAEYRLCAFAVFVLNEWDRNAKTLTGTFVRHVIDSDEIGGGAPDFGARDIRISQ